jgi:mono/diheme cytochrome c family protein
MKGVGRLVLLALAACSKPEPAAGSPVHTLRLPEEQVTMPEAPGRAQFQSACITCHTPRYVLDQPMLPRKTWQAEVDKMRSAYAAPMADADVPAIVDYLVAVRGNGS